MTDKQYQAANRWVKSVKILISESDTFFKDVKKHGIPEKDWVMVFGKIQGAALLKMKKAMRHLK